MRVLIIDDYAPITVLLAAWCEAEGHEPVTAHNGRAGLRCLAERGADVVLLDVDMPGLGGPAVCRLIRAAAEWAHLPVVLMSGRGLPDLTGLASACGATAVISKPFDWAVLARVIGSTARP
jgi:DNA-binding response OmpR family regulator